MILNSIDFVDVDQARNPCIQQSFLRGTRASNAKRRDPIAFVASGRKRKPNEHPATKTSRLRKRFIARKKVSRYYDEAGRRKHYTARINVPNDGLLNARHVGVVSSQTLRRDPS